MDVKNVIIMSDMVIISESISMLLVEVAEGIAVEVELADIDIAIVEDVSIVTVMLRIDRAEIWKYQKAPLPMRIKQEIESPRTTGRSKIWKCCLGRSTYLSSIFRRENFAIGSHQQK